jgi:hypothetical protein
VTRVHADVTGVADGDVLTMDEARSLVVRLAVDPVEQVKASDLRHNGKAITDDDHVQVKKRVIVWRPEHLREGEHHLELLVPRPFLGDARLDWSFTVDGTAPVIDVPSLTPPADIDEPVTIQCQVEEGASLTLDGEPVDVDDGDCTMEFDRPPAGAMDLEAVDEAGNRTSKSLLVPVAYAGGRGVHVSGPAWNDPELQAGVMALIDSGRIDVVELDVKDEGGMIWHRTDVALANESGAAQGLYELRDVVDLLHAKGVRVVGRLVNFNDPELVAHAEATGRMDMVVQDLEGQPLGAYHGFTNFASPDVRQYQVDLAVEAVEAGVDDILLDYVRRPEGDLTQMVFPGMAGSPEEEVAGFVEQLHGIMREHGVPLGASVFGVAATRPETIGQDVPTLARHLDYVAPMLYPALWANGELNVDHPESQPYDIIKASLQRFIDVTEGTGVALVPWLQDFSLDVTYTATEVREQIRAAHELGIDDFLLWDPRVTYTTDALDPGAAPPG